MLRIDIGSAPLSTPKGAGGASKGMDGRRKAGRWELFDGLPAVARRWRASSPSFPSPPSSPPHCYIISQGDSEISEEENNEREL
jgi:hypothetical protein